MIVPRRVALRSLFALAVTAFTGGALGRIATRTPPGAPSGAPHDPLAFDEMYGGRRIRGFSGPGGRPVALVDGRPLHLMRCADGGYVSPIDHYESCPTPLAATRAAVDELGTAPLSRFAAGHGVHTEPTGGSPRGVHA
ncbi:Tyrosinase co-factor protein [Streptomyces venezuelae]|uniref:tyrosinase family oxidase copper chaperone n=1 Tax=Streptomyces gardneri TaxID=66892 RepID=UPI0006BD357D|nr:tyrosinase family oxidase copper chaperone [Streptomyces gardneri]ALO10734.1 Tyrosinase co-factor protein [Streptomyces venezuelae]QPK47706.1 tyrosinase co-factor protein [Streptomyces gardneri]WRK39151.1 tyrosinase family oxidase copper chaperone [Streptomyces venezuelae]CUM38782.1 Tyrosinase cofactor [Streptomyces venezuelae]